MNALHPILASYLPVVEGLARTFGEHCEVALHDMTNPEASIVRIYNGHISGREAGGPVTNLGLKLLRQGEQGHDFILNYKHEGIKDKVIKSSTIFIRDEENKVIGCLCINLDVTHLMMAEATLRQLASFEQEPHDKTEERFAPSITELMDQIIEECIRKVGKPIPFMQKEEKIAFIGMLDEMGLFLIKGAVQHVADLLDVSKYTIYNYVEKKGKQPT
ncbi:PAS domain-containing protein [Brevibacillus ruminantium]|uniref:PAS domain-containing protein n=1 Tax=Brevibacillus ruminantium TaxID=2950604 RepID=A0ABY4WN00_9BACL|nr:PAS domain-containing protein [Brevibacillus ruminantium]USG68229.1 PAS domain-containing protein [Brevibacillus ruminantium]